LLALVGVLMFAGFGAALGSRVLDTMHAPSAPTRLDAAQVAGTRASWVVIDGVLESCRFPDVPSETTAVYRVLFTASGAPIGLLDVYGGRACSDTPAQLTGTLHARTLEDLALPSDASAFLGENLGQDILVLYADDSPRLGIGEASMWSAMALLGLFIAWFYAAAALARAATVRMPALTSRPALPILPARPLSFAPRYRASSAMALGFFAIATMLFAGITASQWPAGGASALDGETIALLAFGGVMTLVFVALLAVVARNALRANPVVRSLREAWAPLIAHEAQLARGVDVGNRVVCFHDPFAAEGESERVVDLAIGANEAEAWIVDGHVLVLRAEGDPVLHVMRVDGGPFDLRDGELPRA
jgi:hypothetical protein